LLIISLVGAASAHKFDDLRNMEEDIPVGYKWEQQGAGLPEYVIDLDAPAEQRFAEPAMQYKDQILKLYQQYENSLYNVWGIQDQYVDMLDYGTWWSNQRDKYLEVQGIAKALGVKTSRVLMINYIFEFVTYCTSILAKQADGTLIHLRILDFGPPTQLKNLTYIASFR